MNVGGIEAIHRVAQNLPQHMLHSLSQVATHTPGYPHTPGAAAAAAGAGFGGFGAFANTVRPHITFSVRTCTLILLIKISTLLHIKLLHRK